MGIKNRPGMQSIITPLPISVPAVKAATTDVSICFHVFRILYRHQPVARAISTTSHSISAHQAFALQAVQAMMPITAI